MFRSDYFLKFDRRCQLKILGLARTPFAVRSNHIRLEFFLTRPAPKVKGGGHTSNPGFSSTTGVHIAMTRFSEITYHEGNQTATLGAGLIWDDVYAVLNPQKVNVLGGRATGIGVAGFILGGGTPRWFCSSDLKKANNGGQ